MQIQKLFLIYNRNLINQFFIILGKSDSNIVTTDVSGSQTDTTIRGLKPRSTYNIHVLAENAIGRSPRSKMLSVTTDDEGDVFILIRATV